MTKARPPEPSRPADPQPALTHKPERPPALASRIAQACRLIEASAQWPGVAALAREVGLSASHFQREFKAATGLTPKAYGAAQRAQRLRRELAQDSASVTDAIYGAGFNSSSRFYAQSNALLGMTASNFQRGGAGAQIRFAVAQCALGALLVACSARGICAIWLDDDAQQLVQQLQERFPNAQLIGADADFERLVAQVVGFVEAPQLGLQLPLDIRGTAFQQRVWQALRQIPPGQTIGYAELAVRIGQPGAARAVASACAANPLAVAIPCHRVVRSDGALSGYRWGIARKQALLDAEAQALAKTESVAMRQPAPVTPATQGATGKTPGA